MVAPESERTGVDLWADRARGLIAKHGWAAHLWRANERFNNRLGNQFAGAITFFSMLSSVPVLMLAFSALGFTLTVLRPAWLQGVRRVIEENLAAGPVHDTVLEYLDRYLFHWQGVGLVGLWIGLWAGSVWMGNLKSAVRAMWRPEFDRVEVKRFLPLEMLVNIGLLLALLALVLVSFAATTALTSGGEWLVALLGLDQVPLTRWLVRLLSVLVSVTGGWLLFFALYTVLPQNDAPRDAVRRGSLAAALVFWLLQAATTQLTAMFARNRSAALWGATLIVGMLFLNLFARLVFYVAAWIATANQPAVARKWSQFDEPLRGRGDVEAVPGHWAAADREHSLVGGSGVMTRDAQATADHLRVRAQSVPRNGRVTNSLGHEPAHRPATGVFDWLAGFAAGAGLGALLARRAARRNHGGRAGGESG